MPTFTMLLYATIAGIISSLFSLLLAIDYAVALIAMYLAIFPLFLVASAGA